MSSPMGGVDGVLRVMMTACYALNMVPMVWELVRASPEQQARIVCTTPVGARAT